MTLRKIFFWGHLVVGVGMGLIILSMCITGSLLAFEHPIVDWSERALQTITPPGPGARPLSASILFAKTQEIHPDARSLSLTLKSDPAATVAVKVGNGDVLYLNPYSGESLGKGSAARHYLHLVEDWHRWLGYKKFGKPVTGAAAISFLLLSLSGIFLWWPRRVYSMQGRGKARDWNWHNTLGISLVPFVLVSTVTGIIMSYGLFKPKSTPNDSTATVKAASLDALVEDTKQKNPNWTSLFIRPSQRPDQAPYVFAQPQPGPRKLLTWVKQIHTGQAWGVPHHIVNFLIALAGILQIWTGFALAWLRFRS